MNAKGRPGSCTGNREKPLINLPKVQLLHSKAREPHEQGFQFLVVEYIVGTNGNDVLKRMPN